MSFPTFLMSFAASHSGCQAKIGATSAHTGKVHTSLWGRAYSLGFGTLEAGILATVVHSFQCEFCTGTTCAPSEPAVAKHTDWL